MTYTSHSRDYSRSRRECFGNDSEFNNGKHCRVCPDRKDCEDTIAKSVNIESLRSARTPMPTSRRYTSTTQRATTPSYYQQTQHTHQTPRHASGGNALLRPVKFNHDRPLMRQYMQYVAFDTAEALAGRAGDLIRSARAEYERELFTEDPDANS
jgi:hypothetical protein